MAGHLGAGHCVVLYFLFLICMAEDVGEVFGGFEGEVNRFPGS